MKNKKDSNVSKREMEEDVVSVNEFTGFLQHLPVSNEDIELYKRLYGGGPYGDDEG